MTNAYKSKLIQGKSVLAHRHAMEVHLGRKLLPTEKVHHINGDKSDNRIENLRLVSNSEHSKIHYPDTIMKPENRKIKRGLIRKAFYIESESFTFLQGLNGIKFSEHLRRAIDEYIIKEKETMISASPSKPIKKGGK